jgi:hypothetical protein
MIEQELARMLNDGRQLRYDGAAGADPAHVDAGALALCRAHCNAVRPGKSCEHRCEGEVSAGIFHSTHMYQMRAMAVAVLTAKPKSRA